MPDSRVDRAVAPARPGVTSASGDVVQSRITPLLCFGRKRSQMSAQATTPTYALNGGQQRQNGSPNGSHETADAPPQADGMGATLTQFCRLPYMEEDQDYTRPTLHALETALSLLLSARDILHQKSAGFPRASFGTTDKGSVLIYWRKSGHSVQAAVPSQANGDGYIRVLEGSAPTIHDGPGRADVGKGAYRVQRVIPMPDYTPFSDDAVVYIALRNQTYMDSETGEVKPNAFLLRERDLGPANGVSLIVCDYPPGIEDLATLVPGLKSKVCGIDAITVGDIRSLGQGLDVVRDAEHHADIHDTWAALH